MFAFTKQVSADSELAPTTKEQRDLLNVYVKSSSYNHWTTISSSDYHCSIIHFLYSMY